MDAQESQIYTAIVIAIFIIFGIIGYFIYSFVLQQKRVVALHRKNAAAVINALEKDRARMAADLHDDLAPVLSAIKMRINSFELTDPEDLVQLTKTNEAINDMASRMRDISFDLMPSTLQKKGLVTAIRELTNLASRKGNLAIHVNHPETPFLLSEQNAIQVYRVLQEIIHNTIKHAAATELTLTLQTGNGKLWFYTKDNGIGFEQKEKQGHGTGLGLNSIQNRVSLLGGKMSLQTGPGLGTAYTIEIPLKNE